MENADVYPDMVTSVLALCRTLLGASFVAFYEGDPIKIPTANLPCVIVEAVQSEINTTSGATGFDASSDRISIRLVMNKEDDFDAGDETDLTERKLRRFVQARDPQTGKYMSGTLMNAIRNDVTFQNLAINSEVEIIYDINPRGNMVATSEAQVILTATGKIPRY